ncbi:MAG: 4-(cytidine 5'-diphospho)-2-C-methyl-D-erythritol kinase, partial [Solirubrobacteraceae bacterium]
MTALATELAPAKINLCLFVGPTRPDGRHEVVTVQDSLSLVDGLEVLAGRDDEVVCERVPGPNLVARALTALREEGWNATPVRVVIHKRIPVAAGMGGGSADAAAMLRLAPRLAGVPAGTLAAIAAQLGADVPGQLQPGPSIATGAGETVQRLGPLPPYGVLVLPQPFPLATVAVYGEADRLGLSRPAAQLEALQAELAAALPASMPPALIVNDLQPAALSLAGEIEDALRAARDSGADHALVCGSGPTVIGIFWGRDGADRARAAVDHVAGAHPAALAAEPMARL